MHLEDAYVVDQQKYGDFDAIGYEAPTSTVFAYSEDDQGEGGWKADAQGKLDKCTGDDVWTVTVTAINGAKATYQASGNCTVLTPNFQNIGKSGS